MKNIKLLGYIFIFSYIFIILGISLFIVEHFIKPADGTMFGFLIIILSIFISFLFQKLKLNEYINDWFEKKTGEYIW